MALWVDKYRPREIGKLDYNNDLTEVLKSIVAREDFPHLLVYGPSGAGKKTRINCILKELYGSGVERTTLVTKTFTTPSNRKLDLQTVNSNYHIELAPGDVGNYDRIVVQDVIKEMAQFSQIDSEKQKPFKVVVLHEVDTLTRDAQHALRRTMEKYSRTCRLILSCESLSRVIDPLRSRCMAVRVSAPPTEEIESILERVVKKEKYDVTPKLLMEISEKSYGNLRRALLMTETLAAREQKLKEGMTIVEPDWELYLRETAGMILKTQNNETLLKVRERLYEVLSRCIPSNIIFSTLIRELLPACRPEAKVEVIHLAAEYQHRLCKGSKAIFHLEAFVAAFMELYCRIHKT
ncbi:hypothetical protein WR25_14059 [Diploscapter pachys]|uniref:Replication factor C subunit 3 n=1 Tax=Diploscapter pachys TaxID=2018661 RepID=A0A2A2JG03_9BILA|nr:hypothetical protein WR25_14059 [Diploscapter pachys]